jgi:hypothetical protein
MARSVVYVKKKQADLQKINEHKYNLPQGLLKIWGKKPNIHVKTTIKYVQKRSSRLN